MSGDDNASSSATSATPGSGKSAPEEAASFPLAAQIALKEFELPDFPPQASRLRQLTLTADIKLDEYQGKVQIPSDAIITQGPLPNLPQSVTHLSLELFGLGFPGKPPFLGRLARALPNITTLTFFSCLIDGLDEASRNDAEAFFELLPNLEELHIIDSFARPGFFKAIGEILEKRTKQPAGQDGGVKMVDVSYTFRGHEDSDFLARVQGEDLPSLIVPGVVGASFDFVPEVVDELAEGGKQDKEEKVAEGILPFASDGRAPTALKKRFKDLGSLQSLKVLNLGMWALRPADLGEILSACAGLADLTASVLLEDNWVDELIKAFEHEEVGADLEGIEVIGVPDKAVEEGEDWKQGLSGTLVTQADVEKLNKACPRLGKFGMSILKVKSAPSVLFFYDQGVWAQQ